MLVDAGRVLDNFYIPTWYPNSHAERAPFLPVPLDLLVYTQNEWREKANSGMVRAAAEVIWLFEGDRHS